MTSVVGVIGTGDMGSAVGKALQAAGYRVVTALDGRSQLSRRLAIEAGMEDLGSLQAVLGECELLLSILPPAEAVEFARQAVSILAAANREIVYADCNAVSPATVTGIAALFDSSSARFVDVGIVGPPPQQGRANPTRFYVSGSSRQSVIGVGVPEIRMIDMGEEVGRASAIKICYASLNKGVDALFTNVMLAAARLGVDAELRAELASSQPEAASRIERRVPFLAAAADRYVGEMQEIAASFDAAGVSGDFYRGAEWVYALLARSTLGAESRATLPDQRTLDEALAAFLAAIED